MKTPFRLAAALCASAALFVSCKGQPEQQEGNFADNLKLSEYRPVSVFKTPQSDIRQASFPVIDIHSHAYVEDVEGLLQWVKDMDENNVEKVIIQTKAYGGIRQTV